MTVLASQTDAEQTGGPQVPEKAKRRTYTAAFKRQVLDEYDAAPEGHKGEVLRRYGLYSATIARWRKAAAEVVLSGFRVE